MVRHHDGRQARLRSYQRDLLAMRQLSLAHAARSPSPCASVPQPERWRGMPAIRWPPAGTTSKSCRVPIAMNHQNNTGASRRGWPSWFCHQPSANAETEPTAAVLKKTLKARIDALANAMPGTKLEAVFVGAPGESDLVWAVCSCSMASPCSSPRCCSSSTCAAAKMAPPQLPQRKHLAAGTGEVGRSLVMALPVDAATCATMKAAGGWPTSSPTRRPPSGKHRAEQHRRR